MLLGCVGTGPVGLTCCEETTAGTEEGAFGAGSIRTSGLFRILLAVADEILVDGTVFSFWIGIDEEVSTAVEELVWAGLNVLSTILFDFSALFTDLSSLERPKKSRTRDF
jgi:hypothetical protein